jgi:hypothetical protein
MIAAAAPMARPIGGWFRGFLGAAIAAAWHSADRHRRPHLCSSLLISCYLLRTCPTPRRRGSAPKSSGRSSPPWARKPQYRKIKRPFPPLACATVSALVSTPALFEPRMPSEDQRQTPATVPRLFDELFEAPQCLGMQVGLTGGNVRRDAIRVVWSSIFFLLAILPWHFRVKTPL